MTHLDLFSGIGGFALAARWAGLTTIAFSEIDPYATRVLAKQFPGVPNLGDIRKISGVSADVITGGFPCQPFSCAGKRRGAEDDRHLWPEMLRVIADARPAWIVGENVPGIIGMELDGVLLDLENLGYEARPIVVPACAVDAQHRRDRLWILAHAKGRRALPVEQPGQRSGSLSCRATLADPDREREPQPSGFESEERRRAGDGGQAVANTNGDDSRRGQQDRRETPTWDEIEDGREALADADSGQRHGRRSALQMGRRGGTSEAPNDGDTCGTQWLPEPGVGRVAHGVSRRVDRLRGLGNAIVPQVAFQFLSWIVAQEQTATEES